MILKDYAIFLDPKKKSKNINNVLIKRFDDKKINLLGMKYLLIDKDLNKEIKKIEAIDSFELVFSGKFVKIYKNKKAYPRAFLIDDGKIKERKIEIYEPNKVVIGTDKKDRGLLVLTDNFYPGWEVLLEENRGRVKKYKDTFRAVEINKGINEVTFKFLPKSFYLGLLITGLILFLCLLKLAF